MRPGLITAAVAVLSFAAAGTPLHAGALPLVPLDRPGVLDTIRIAPAGELIRKSPALERVGIERETAAGAAVMGKKDPLVILTEPRSGLLTRGFQRVSGRIGNGITKAFLRINEDTRIVPVTDGRFSASAALRPGLNTITALAWDLEGNLGKTSMQVFVRPEPGGPEVSLTEPEDSATLDITRNRVVAIRAKCSDPRVEEGVLVVNNIPRQVSMKAGVLDQELALMPGLNEISVEVVDREGRAGTSRPVRVHTFDAAPKDLVAVLSWDSSDADLDLHIWDSFGHHTFRDARDPYQCDAAIPKGTLDMDRKGGYGPEVFSLESAESEVYAIYANYSPGIAETDGADAYLRLILYGDEPARRIMRVFGPHRLDASNPSWEAAHVKMPEGVFFQEKDADLKKTLGMDSRAAKRLALMLEEENRQFGLLAISAMGQIKSEESVDTLLNTLSTGTVELKRAAAGALWNIKSVESVSGLVQAIRDEDREVRRAAAGALGEIGDRRAVYPLTELLSEEGDEQVRVEAIRALGLLGDPRALNTLASQAGDPDPRVRTETMRALGNIRGGETGEILVEALKDLSEGVREAAARSLGRLGMKEALRDLSDALYFDEDEAVRIQAAIALGVLGEEDAVRELEKAARGDYSPRVRFCAEKSLKALTEVREAAPAYREPREYAIPEDEEDLVIY